MDTKLFGTDGIRGAANCWPLEPQTTMLIARAAGHFFSRGGQISKPVIIGKDTRVSGGMLEGAIVAGLCSVGCDVRLAGVVPTPAVAYLARSMDASGGLVISASHNPFEDNGIKFFLADGTKLSDEQEREIEHSVKSQPIKPADRVGACRRITDAGERYQQFLSETLLPNGSLKGLKMVIDCAHGATWQLAPDLFQQLGADITVIGNAPDGGNINLNCGSEHPEALAAAVIETGADLGLAFDGDGDRVLAVDETGAALSGDQLIVIGAAYLSQIDCLPGRKVVTTVMSNAGLGLALKEMQIGHEICGVGDRQVAARMRETGAQLGGENSGHTIFSKWHSTGDGMLTGLKLLEAMRHFNQPLSQLAELMKILPQKLEAVAVARKPELDSVPAIRDAILAAEAALGSNGRVLVRYSGTQPVCRVMVEAAEMQEAENHCQRIVQVVGDNLAE